MTRTLFTGGQVFDGTGAPPASADVVVEGGPDGSYVRVGHDHYGRSMNRVTGSIAPVLAMTAASLVVRQPPRPTRSTPRPERLARLAELVAQGRLRPVVDRTFPLEDVVPGLQRLRRGEARGRLILLP